MVGLWRPYLFQENDLVLKSLDLVVVVLEEGLVLLHLGLSNLGALNGGIGLTAEGVHLSLDLVSHLQSEETMEEKKERISSKFIHSFFLSFPLIQEDDAGGEKEEE